MAKRLALTSLVLLALVVSLLAPPAPGVAAAPVYTLTDLGVLPGGGASGASAVNNLGQAVGWARPLGSAAQHAVRFDQGRAIDLGIPPGYTNSQANDINDSGQIVGSGTSTPQSPQHAILLSPPGATTRCFPETGACVGGRFLQYWRANGGLALYGYPLTGEIRERLEDGRDYTVQYFERARFERHPENAPPDDVLLGQFGRRIHPADPPVPPPGGLITQDGFYFEETGHYVPGRFFAFWHANGGLAQFGYPIGEAIEERLEDGNVYRVQYFERARFALHPENQPPNDILLGQFGRRILAERGR